MELYFLATGAAHKMLLFEQRLNTIPMLLPFTTKEGKQMAQPIFPMLEEIKLFRYVFPKEHLDEVLNTLEFPVEKQKDNYTAFNLQVWSLKKILNAKTIPQPNPKAKPYLINKENIALKPIGIKEDVTATFPDGNTHEAI